MFFRNINLRNIMIILFTGIYTILISPAARAQDGSEVLEYMTGGIREIILAGIIVALLSAIYTIILIKRGDKGEGSCVCGHRRHT